MRNPAYHSVAGYRNHLLNPNMEAQVSKFNKKDLKNPVAVLIPEAINCD